MMLVWHSLHFLSDTDSPLGLTSFPCLQGFFSPSYRYTLPLHLPSPGFIHKDHAGLCYKLSTARGDSSSEQRGLREKPLEGSAVGGALVPAQGWCLKCLVLTAQGGHNVPPRNPELPKQASCDLQALQCN